MNNTRTAVGLVAAAKATIENLTARQLEAELSTGTVVLVDVREPDELASGALPDAVHIPRGMLEFRADPASPHHDPRLDPSQRVVLYCASGARSALGAKALIELGYRNVAHLDGGINAWTDTGRPVEPLLRVARQNLAALEALDDPTRATNRAPTRDLGSATPRPDNPRR